jgi:hypothetical protein
LFHIIIETAGRLETIFPVRHRHAWSKESPVRSVFCVVRTKELSGGWAAAHEESLVSSLIAVL